MFLLPTSSRSACGCFPKAHAIRRATFCHLKRERFIWLYKHRWAQHNKPPTHISKSKAQNCCDFKEWTCVYKLTWLSSPFNLHMTWSSGAKVIYLARIWDVDTTWTNVNSKVNLWNLCVSLESTTSVVHHVLTNRGSSWSLIVYSVEILCSSSVLSLPTDTFTGMHLFYMKWIPKSHMKQFPTVFSLLGGSL